MGFQPQTGSYSQKFLDVISLYYITTWAQYLLTPIGHLLYSCMIEVIMHRGFNEQLILNYMCKHVAINTSLAW